MIIKFEKVNYYYNDNLPYQRQVLKDINLEITSGEFVGLVGPTGSGKTTLLQQFTGLLKPQKGKITVDNRDIWQKDHPMKELRRKIGILFQFPEAQLFEETVYDDVAFGPKAIGIDHDEISDRVKNSLKLVGMDKENIGDRSPHHLSEGEKRRVAFAGVLAMSPEMLILDEPTAGLDRRGTRLIGKILKQLSEHGITILIISHNIDFVIELASRIIILNHGKICYDGDRDNLLIEPDLFLRNNILLPKIPRLAYHLYKAKVISTWQQYSLHGIKAQIKRINSKGE